MVESGIVLPNSTLDPQVLSKLTTYEDYLSYYIQLSEATDAVSWVKADFLLYMFHKMGANSLLALSKDMKQPFGTVDNYIRTARAFPVEKRNPAMSFSHHFKASFADVYDEKTKTFLTEKRFEWLNKAQDERMSTRTLQANISEEKEKQGNPELGVLCSHCGKPNEKLQKWTMMSPGTGKRVINLYLHEVCFVEILKFIYDGHQEGSPAESQENNSGN